MAFAISVVSIVVLSVWVVVVPVLSVVIAIPVIFEIPLVVFPPAVVFLRSLVRALEAAFVNRSFSAHRSLVVSVVIVPSIVVALTSGIVGVLRISFSSAIKVSSSAVPSPVLEVSVVGVSSVLRDRS